MDDRSDFIPLDPATLPQYPRGAAVNGLGIRDAAALIDRAGAYHLDDEGSRRLLDAITLDDEVDAAVDRMTTVEIEVSTGDVTVIHRGPIPQARSRHLAAVLGMVGAVAVALGVVAPVPVAQAAVVPVTRPVVVTVAGPTARVDVDVVSTEPIAADGGHVVTLLAGNLLLRGAATARGAALVHIGRAVPSRLLTPGTTTATLIDGTDLRTATIPFTVLRASRVAVTAAIPLPGGVLVTGTARHYDIPTGTYRGDVASPVLVQLLAGGRWVTVDTVTTIGPDGAVAAIVPTWAGRVTVRLVRPAGATVTGASSAARATFALPVASARGDL